MSSISSEDTSPNEKVPKMDKSKLQKTLLAEPSSISTSETLAKVKDLRNTENLENSNSVVDLAPKKPNSNKKTCASCGKKLKLVEFSGFGKCKCEKIFCTLHRFPSNHDCTFDYKKHAEKELREKNQRVVADKVTRF